MRGSVAKGFAHGEIGRRGVLRNVLRSLTSGRRKWIVIGLGAIILIYGAPYLITAIFYRGLKGYYHMGVCMCGHRVFGHFRGSTFYMSCPGHGEREEAKTGYSTRTEGNEWLVLGHDDGRAFARLRLEDGDLYFCTYRVGQVTRAWVKLGRVHDIRQVLLPQISPQAELLLQEFRQEVLRQDIFQRGSGYVAAPAVPLPRAPFSPDLSGAETVVLSEDGVTDDVIAALKQRKDLHTLVVEANFRGTEVGIARLTELAGLQTLVLACPNVSVADLAALKGLKELQTLDLHSQLGLTDATTGFLREMSTLKSLSLENTEVSDVTMASLMGLEGLQTLDIASTEVTDTGLTELKIMKSLQSLDLSFTQVTDAGLAHLRELKHLRTLNLARTQVTDAGLEFLKQLTSLESLDLRGTKVTDTGVEGLMKALPKTAIVS